MKKQLLVPPEFPLDGSGYDDQRAAYKKINEYFLLLEQDSFRSKLSYVEKDAAYTITENDFTVNCVGNSFTLTLPSNIDVGKIFNIKNSGNGTIKVNTTNNELIDGVFIQTLNTYDSMKVQYTGFGWIII